MREEITRIVYPVLRYGLTLQPRLKRGEKPSLENEQANLRALLKSVSESRQWPGYGGDGEFLGIRYALTCWLDETFTAESSPWRDEWNESKLETTLYETNDRGWKFWEQAKAAEQLPAAYGLAARHDTMVLAEEFVSGRELTASLLDGEALPLIWIEAPGGNYDYQNKYFTDETKYHCPAGIPIAKETEIRAMALKAFEVLGCEGWGRADLILRGDGSFSFLEMNTSPGMTGHSLVPMAARAIGISYEDLCVKILELAHVG